MVIVIVFFFVVHFLPWDSCLHDIHEAPLPPVVPSLGSQAIAIRRGVVRALPPAGAPPPVHVLYHLLTCVSVMSYLGNHVYTGIESTAHAVDRVVAPVAFVSCIYSTYAMCGAGWAALSLAALKCHFWVNYYAKRDMYERFVVWHCLWHAVGVGLMLLCFTANRVVGECWKGGEREEVFYWFTLLVFLESK